MGTNWTCFRDIMVVVEVEDERIPTFTLIIRYFSLRLPGVRVRQLIQTFVAAGGACLNPLVTKEPQQWTAVCPLIGMDWIVVSFLLSMPASRKGTVKRFRVRFPAFRSAAGVIAMRWPSYLNSLICIFERHPVEIWGVLLCNFTY